MSLDMYLSAKKYLRIDNNVEEEKISKSISHLLGEHPGEIKEVASRVAYWNEANAVHNWFVQNVQDGKDDCKEYFVSREQLKLLIDLCRTSLETRTTIDGCDYSSMELDDVEMYDDDIRYTIKTLEPLLEADSRWKYYYNSSW